MLYPVPAKYILTNLHQIDSPYGRKGFGQENLQTGQITGYQSAPTTWGDSERGGRSGQESSLGKFEPYPESKSQWEDTERNGIPGQEDQYGEFNAFPERKSQWKKVTNNGVKGFEDQYGAFTKLPKGDDEWGDPQELNGKWYIENQTDGDMKLLGGRPSMYDEKINDLMGIGLSREDAIRQLTNMPKGQTFGVDLTGLEALETPIEDDSTSRVTGKARTAYELVDTGHVTGFGSAFRSMTAHVFGGLGFPNNEDVLEARQELDIIVQQLARATAQSPRFAEAERQWILNTFDIRPQVFNSPEGLKAELTAIHNQFSNQMQELYGNC